jgi:hypothetical protein
MSKTILIATVLFSSIIGLMSFKSTKPVGPYYEMRVYYCHPGKLENLLTRFRDHTTKLFEKHGMKNIGYWLPVDNKDNKLVYILSYPSKSSRDSSWKAFGTDPAWKAVQSASEVSGKIVAKVESTFMTETDFSPNDFTNSTEKRVFELRTYKASPYNLGLLLARFRNHTLGLFEKHGMKNLAYYTENGKDDMLIYLISHKSKEAAAASFGSFVKDPDWTTAKDASEKLAKGPITSNIVSEFLVPTDFSTWK